MRTRRIASRRQWVTRLAVCISCACCLAVARRAEGQEDGGAVGGIRGVILDADAGDPIGNARVTIGELGQTLSSDAQGRFVFDAVRPGIYEITVSKAGYARERKGDIAVTAGVFREVRVTMTSEVYEMEELVVSGELVGEGETALLIERQDASGILESIGAEAFSQQGVSTAADALKKLVGTSVQDDRYVVVRGMSDRYLSTLLNGGPVPSSDPERRAVNLDIFPTEVIDSITSSKTFTPDLPGESSGGNINIRTLSFPEEFTFKVGGSISYNSQATLNDRWRTYDGGGVPTFGFDSKRKLPDEYKQVAPGNPPQVAPSKEVGLQWGEATKAFSPVMGTTEETPGLSHSWSAVLGETVQMMGRPLGILLAATYDRDYSYQPDGQYGRYNYVDGRPIPEPLSGNFDGVKVFETDKGEDEVLASGLFNLSFEPSEDNRISLTLLYNQTAKDEALRKRNDDAEEHILQYTERSLNALQLAGEHIFEDLNRTRVNWLAARGNSSEKQPDGRRFFSRFSPSPGGNQYTVEGIGLTSEQPLLRTWKEFADESYSARMDIAIPITPEGEDGSEIKLGIYWDKQSRDYDQLDFAYQAGAFAQTSYTADGDESWQEVFGELEDNIGSVPFEARYDYYYNLLIGRGIPPATADAVARARANAEADRNLYWFLYDTDDPFGEYEADQLITAGYAMMDLVATDRLTVTFGVRLEATDLRAASPLPDDRFGEGSLFPVGEAHILRLDALPALLLAYEAAENMNFRAAYGRTIARPTFREIAPVVTRDLIEGEFFIGNPLLEMSVVDNLDVRWEWFPKPGDVVSLGAFYKLIDDPIEFASNVDFDFYENAPLGRVWGLELEARKRFDDLAGAFAGFGWLENIEVGVNAAYIASKVRKSDTLIDQLDQAGSDLPRTRPLQGQPTYTANASIAYDNADSGTFMGLFYNITGPFLYKAGADPLTPDVYTQPAPQVDFTFSQVFYDHWKVTLRAKNLLDPEYQWTYNTKSIERTYESYRKGREYSMGVSFDW